MYLPWSWLKVALFLHPTCTNTIQSFSERQTRFLRIPVLTVIVWVENKHVLGNDLNFCMLFEKQTEVRQFIFVANDCSLSKEMSWQKTSKISWNWEQQQQQKIRLSFSEARFPTAWLPDKLLESKNPQLSMSEPYKLLTGDMPCGVNVIAHIWCATSSHKSSKLNKDDDLV